MVYTPPVEQESEEKNRMRCSKRLEVASETSKKRKQNTEKEPKKGNLDNKVEQLGKEKTTSHVEVIDEVPTLESGIILD